MQVHPSESVFILPFNPPDHATILRPLSFPDGFTRQKSSRSEEKEIQYPSLHFRTGFNVSENFPSSSYGTQALRHKKLL